VFDLSTSIFAPPSLPWYVAVARLLLFWSVHARPAPPCWWHGGGFRWQFSRPLRIGLLSCPLSCRSFSALSPRRLEAWEWVQGEVCPSPFDLVSFVPGLRDNAALLLPLRDQYTRATTRTCSTGEPRTGYYCIYVPQPESLYTMHRCDASPHFFLVGRVMSSCRGWRHRGSPLGQLLYKDYCVVENPWMPRDVILPWVTSPQFSNRLVSQLVQRMFLIGCRYTWCLCQGDFTSSAQGLFCWRDFVHAVSWLVNRFWRTRLTDREDSIVLSLFPQQQLTSR